MKTPDLLSNPQFRIFIENFTTLSRASQQLSFQEARKLSTEFFLAPGTVFEKIKRIENVDILGPDQNRIPIRFFIPEATGPLPVFIYFHRGGWVFGNIEEADPVCRKLANHLNCVVASVDYRLAPEHRFPKPLEDCYAATQWIAAHAAQYGGNPQALIIGGESAGGNLATAVALRARDCQGPTLQAQLLIYPIISADLKAEAYENCPDRYFLTKESMQFFWSMYLPSGDYAKDPYASPDCATDLSQLPPTFIITAEYDPLHHEAENYAKQLREAGVKVTTKCFPGVIHGFLDLPIYEEEQKVKWIQEIGQLLASGYCRELCSID